MRAERDAARALLVRALAALRATLTPAGHLAQRVTHEHLGYCGWRTESERCAEQRALIAALIAALETPRGGAPCAWRAQEDLEDGDV